MDERDNALQLQNFESMIVHRSGRFRCQTLVPIGGMKSVPNLDFFDSIRRLTKKPTAAEQPILTSPNDSKLTRQTLARRRNDSVEKKTGGFFTSQNAQEKRMKSGFAMKSASASRSLSWKWRRTSRGVSITECISHILSPKIARERARGREEILARRYPPRPSNEKEWGENFCRRRR